jgi:hypothetical protein
MLSLALFGPAVAQICAATSPGGSRIAPKGDASAPIVEARLRPVLLDRTLFQPDRWWRYDGSDLYPKTKARFVSLGRRSVLNSGARVLYGVVEYANAREAEKGIVPRDPHRGRNVRVYRRPLKVGDGGYVVGVLTLDAKGAPQLCERRAYVRWGRFVVCVIGDSNMRAFVARPAKGERPWLHEPVFDRVFERARAVWADAGSALTGPA